MSRIRRKSRFRAPLNVCKLGATMTLASTLSERERTVLAAVCDAFHPRLAVEAGDDERLFTANALDIGVPAAAEDAIGLAAPAQRDEFRQLLRLLDNRMFGLVVSGAARGVSAMTAEQRGRLLTSMSTSTIPQMRTGFQALKRLSSFLFYSVRRADGSNPALEAMAYAPSARPATAAPRLEVT